MDKRTLLAVVLSTVVITIGFMLQAKFFPAPEQEIAETTVVEEAEESTAIQTEEAPRQASASSSELLLDTDKIIEEETITAETNRFFITFSNSGGVITSLKLKEHEDNGQPLEMIFRGSEDQAAFELAFGDFQAEPLSANFEYQRIGEYIFEFSKAFLAPPDQSGVRNPFVLRKTYKFTEDDYMMELKIGIENSVNKVPPLNFDGYSYSLILGPQIGPEFTELDNRYFYRRFYTYNEKKAKVVKLKDGAEVLEERAIWTGLAGKYFAAIAVTDSTNYEITMTEENRSGLPQANEIIFSRPPVKSSNSQDTFKFYFGPKLKKYLTPYNSPDENGFNMKDLNLDEIEDSSSILGWLEWLLQKALIFINRFVPNYGLAIILLTIIIKVVLFPLTKKSTQSTARMSALAPQMEELKAQYKEQPDKLNKAMGELYKKEGVSPMGGCLPMLLQFPFFIAMYGLLNKYFEFRGAVFIPGWINDLSSPESIFTLGFEIPFLGSAIRLLPIIFVGSQILSSKIMQSNQTAAAGNASTMKMMTYAMPIMFFFILYNAPSGLLVYWIFSNLFTMLQQMYSNRHLKAAPAGGGGKSGPNLKIVKKDEQTDEPPKKVVPPAKKKPKKKKKK